MTKTVLAGALGECIQLVEENQYRIVGSDVSVCPAAQPFQPGLEDGYVRLMNNAGGE